MVTLSDVNDLIELVSLDQHISYSFNTKASLFVTVRCDGRGRLSLFPSGTRFGATAQRKTDPGSDDRGRLGGYFAY